MTILNQNYVVYILIIALFFSIAILKHEKGYYRWIKRYWFYGRSVKSKAAVALYLFGFLALFIALLDFRGREERIEAEVPDQRTVIVIDTSASMLTEDVKPSRFERSIFLARHFIKQATGHQISVVVFSDMTKRLIPFTNDLDLLDARVSALSSMDIYTGGSNIQLAINQAVQYLKADNNNTKAIGNILLITDGEEQQEGAAVEVPAGVVLSMIGVGTARGGRIPLRTREGTFRGYKRSSGEEVVSKLDEDFFREITSKTSGSRYWIATSYSVNSDAILSYMNTAFEREMRDGEIKIQPVLGLPVIWLGLILLAISGLISNMKSFKALALIASLLLPIGFGQNQLRAEEEEAKSKLSERGNILVERFSQGRLDYSQKLELAQELMKSEMYEEANILNEELVKAYPELENDTDFQLNRGTTKLVNGDWENSKAIFDKVKKRTSGKKREEVESLIRNNYLLAAQIQEQQEQEQQKKEENKEKNKEEQQKEESGKGENDKEESQGEDQKDDSAEGKNSEKPQDEKEKSEGPEGDQENENEEEGEKEEPKDSNAEKEEDIVEEIENKDTSNSAKREELPGLIQQIMNDDRSLQERQLDTSTNDSKRSRQQRDW